MELGPRRNRVVESWEAGMNRGRAGLGCQKLVFEPRDRQVKCGIAVLRGEAAPD